MSATTTPERKSQLSTALARDRLGVAAVVFFVMSAAAPLTVVAGVVPTGLAVTGLTAHLDRVPRRRRGAGGLLRRLRRDGPAHRQRRRVLRVHRPRPRPAVRRRRRPGSRCSPTTCFQLASYGGFGAIAAPLFADWFGVDAAMVDARAGRLGAGRRPRRARRRGQRQGAGHPAGRRDRAGRRLQRRRPVLRRPSQRRPRRSTRAAWSAPAPARCWSWRSPASSASSSRWCSARSPATRAAPCRGPPTSRSP